MTRVTRVEICTRADNVHLGIRTCIQVGDLAFRFEILRLGLIVIVDNTRILATRLLAFDVRTYVFSYADVCAVVLNA